MRNLLPWRFTKLGGLTNTMVLAPIRRIRLRSWARGSASSSRGDITVLIPHKNRAGYRLANSLRSIRDQDHPQADVQILLVDYSSDPESQAFLEQMVEDFGVTCIFVDGVGDWSRSHCLNIGIRFCRTKYLMVSDVDILLAPNYLSTGIAALKNDPLAIALSPCLHLKEEVTGRLESFYSEGTLDTEVLKPHGEIKTDWSYSPGMVLTFTHFLELIHGYDEFYLHYGAEDDDLLKRLEYMGLRPHALPESTYYLHQWHPRHEGVDGDTAAEAIRRNREYLEGNETIVRNPTRWGKARVRVVAPG